MFSELPLVVNAVLFLGAAWLIQYSGVRLARSADKLADLSGLGEAIVGAVFLGGATSLPGLVASATAAWEGSAEIAVTNALGGLAIQTTFLAVADFKFKQANLEHSAASLENIFQGVLLILLLAIPLLAVSTPDLALGHVHPASFLLIAIYVGGLKLVAEVKREPMWKPHATAETVPDEPDAKLLAARGGLKGEVGTFAWAAIMVCIAGYTAAETAIVISERTGMSQTLVGTILLATATSLPELVTSVAAVRQGAPTLAVGDILGGNAFEVLFLPFSDLIYSDGPIYAAVSNRLLYLMALSMFLIAVLILGLIRREKHGVFNIGLEGVLIVGGYVAAMGALVVLEI